MPAFAPVLRPPELGILAGVGETVELADPADPVDPVDPPPAVDTVVLEEELVVVDDAKMYPLNCAP